ncbi:hypothetical protein BLNAU_15536 [Blattamonas nauphoetae]|uniref:Uncharacterized protein n=1 Tax=Blattamonas nauphoetae TaxID=2049346 RepID=A0ABQ9XFC7_9EUKA|nr:hypothetical protein BLNAU_15536 [Blattamonas nauphoetae]
MPLNSAIETDTMEETLINDPTSLLSVPLPTLAEIQLLSTIIRKDPHITKRKSQLPLDFQPKAHSDTLTLTSLLTVPSPGLSLSNLDNFIPVPRQSPEYLQKVASKSLTNRNPTQQYYQQIMHDLYQSHNTPHLISHSLCLSKKPVVRSRPIPPKPRLDDNIDFISSTDQSEQRKTRSLSFHSHHSTLGQIPVPSFHQSSSGHSTDDGSLSASEKPDPQLVAVRPLLTRQSSFSMHGQGKLMSHPYAMTSQFGSLPAPPIVRKKSNIDSSALLSAPLTRTHHLFFPSVHIQSTILARSVTGTPLRHERVSDTEPSTQKDTESSTEGTAGGSDSSKKRKKKLNESGVEKTDTKLSPISPLSSASLFTSTPVISHAAIRSFFEAFEQEQELEAQNELLFGSDASEYEDETESEGSLSARVEFQKIPSYELNKAIPQPVSAVVLSRTFLSEDNEECVIPDEVDSATATMLFVLLRGVPSFGDEQTSNFEFNFEASSQVFALIPVYLTFLNFNLLSMSLKGSSPVASVPDTHTLLNMRSLAHSLFCTPALNTTTAAIPPNTICSRPSHDYSDPLKLHELLQLDNPYSLLHWPFINGHYKTTTTQTVSKHRLREIEREAMEIQNEMLSLERIDTFMRKSRKLVLPGEDQMFESTTPANLSASSPVARIGHTTEIHLTNILLTSVTRKALLSEFDRVHRFRQSKAIPISTGKAGNPEPLPAKTTATLNLSPFEPTLNTKIASNLTKLCTFSSGNVFNKIEQLRMIFPPSSPPGNLMSVLAPFIPITALGDHTYPFAPSLVQFTRQLVVQLASELHPQWTSVGDESDDGSVYSDDMDDMPMPSPSTRNPIDSLCTIQFGDALAEALSLLFFALLKEMGLEGVRAADEGQGTSFFSEMNTFWAQMGEYNSSLLSRKKKLIASKPYLALRLRSTNQASPYTSPFLVAQDSLNIAILNKLPILPDFVPDATSKEYATKVTPIQAHDNYALPRSDVLDFTGTPQPKTIRHWLEAAKSGMLFGELVEFFNLCDNYSFSNIDINDFYETGWISEFRKEVHDEPTKGSEGGRREELEDWNCLLPLLLFFVSLPVPSLAAIPFRILPMLSSLVLSSSPPLPHASFFTALFARWHRVLCEYAVHLRASSPFLLLHVYHSLCFFVCLGGVAVRTLIRQYHPAVLLFLADHSAAVGAEVQSNLITWLVNSLYSDVHAIDEARMDLLGSPLHAAAEGRGEEAAEPQHTRLHAAPLAEHARAVAPSLLLRPRQAARAVCGRRGAGVGAVPMGRGGGCGAVHVCVCAVGECPVAPHQLHLRRVRSDEPAINKTRVVGVYSRLSSLTDTFRLFSHSNTVLLNRVLSTATNIPLVLTALAAYSQSPNFWEMNQARLMLLNLYASLPFFVSQHWTLIFKKSERVFEDKYKVTCLDVVNSWRVMAGMSLLAPLGEQADITQLSPIGRVMANALSLFTISRCPRASHQSASCCSFSLPPPSLLAFAPIMYIIRTAEEMLLFDVSLEGWGDSCVDWRTKLHHHITITPQFHLTTSSRSAVEDSDAALRIIDSLALPTPHPHHRHASSRVLVEVVNALAVVVREKDTPVQTSIHVHTITSLFETAATLVEKALDKRALNLSRDSRSEMRMAARQNTSPSRSILTCSHHPSHHTLVSLFQHLLSHLIFVPAPSRLQFSSVTAFHVQSDAPDPALFSPHSPIVPGFDTATHLLLGGQGTVQVDHLLHVRTDTLRLFTLRLPPPLNECALVMLSTKVLCEYKQVGIHQQTNVEFFQMMMARKDPAIALVAAQFLKEYSFLRKEEQATDSTTNSLTAAISSDNTLSLTNAFFFLNQ